MAYRNRAARVSLIEVQGGIGSFRWSSPGEAQCACGSAGLAAPAVTYFDRSSKSRLLHQLVREFLLVRKESRWATGLMVVGTAAFLVACEHKRPRASKTGSDDANKAFAEYAARANSTATATPGSGSHRGGTRFSGGGGAPGGNQSGF